MSCPQQSVLSSGEISIICPVCGLCLERFVCACWEYWICCFHASESLQQLLLYVAAAFVNYYILIFFYYGFWIIHLAVLYLVNMILLTAISNSYCVGVFSSLSVSSLASVLSLFSHILNFFYVQTVIILLTALVFKHSLKTNFNLPY